MRSQNFTQIRTRARTRALTRSSNRPRTSDDRAFDAGGVDLEALAVVDEVQRMRLLQNFHAIDQLWDKPGFVSEKTILDEPVKDELTERLAILTGPYEQMTYPKGRRPAD